MMIEQAHKTLVMLALAMACSAPGDARAEQTEGGRGVEDNALDQLDIELIGFGQMFSDLAYTTSDAQSFSAFELRRAELGLGFMKGRTYGFMVNAEAIRSAGARSYFGIDENSMVFRAKQAYGVAAPKLGPGNLTVRFGLIPDVYMEVVESAYDLRGVQALATERSRFYDTSDLGLSAAYSAFDGIAEVRVAITNGEGRNQYELNTGKNTTVVLTGRTPSFTFMSAPARLGLHLSYRDGSVGTSSRKNHRLSGALTFAHPRHFAGFQFSQATGYLGRGDLNARVIEAWANSALYPTWLGVYAKFSSTQTDLSADDSHARNISAGLYADLIESSTSTRPVLGFPRMRLYAGWSKDTFAPGASVIPGVPSAADSNTFMLTLSARGSANASTR